MPGRQCKSHKGQPAAAVFLLQQLCRSARRMLLPCRAWPHLLQRLDDPPHVVQLAGVGLIGEAHLHPTATTEGRHEGPAG